MFLSLSFIIVFSPRSRTQWITCLSKSGVHNFSTDLNVGSIVISNLKILKLVSNFQFLGNHWKEENAGLMWRHRPVWLERKIYPPNNIYPQIWNYHPMKGAYFPRLRKFRVKANRYICCKVIDNKTFQLLLG